MLSWVLHNPIGICFEVSEVGGWLYSPEENSDIQDKNVLKVCMVM
jgi:hypothetical protein